MLIPKPAHEEHNKPMNSSKPIPSTRAGPMHQNTKETLTIYPRDLYIREIEAQEKV
jgi:hypothetical protein